MRNWFTLAGVDSRDFGVYISGQGTFGAPAKAYELLGIPGRNGAIIGPEKRLENATVTYSCYIYSNFEKNIADFRTFLLSLDGYQVLTDSYHTDEFRLAVYQGPFDPEVTRKNDAGSFELVFSCKPQRYLNNGTVRYVFDLLGTSIYGTDIFVEEPAFVQTNRLTANLCPGGYQNLDDPSFSVGGSRKNPLPELYEASVALYINNSMVFPDVSLGSYRKTSGTVDYLAGTITVNSVAVNTPAPNNWSSQPGHIFYASLNRNDLDKIKYCPYYTPVASTGDFGGETGKITIVGSSVYIYDPGFSSITSFRNWLTSLGNARRFVFIASLATPYNGTFTPYVPDYPEEPFTISTYPGNGVYLMLPYAATDGMENPTKFPASPMIRVNGTGTVTINDIVITVSDVTSYVDIDCELMDCYEGSTNRNDDVSFSTYDFPVLMPGVNPVYFVGPSSVEITPRWWRV